MALDDEMVDHPNHGIEGVDALFAPLDKEVRIPPPIKDIGRHDIGKEETETGSRRSDSSVELVDKPTFKGWDSPEDPGNPRNWSFGKKAFHTAIPALYGFVV